MTRYGTETETTYLDQDKSTIDIISNIKDYAVTTKFKRISVRVKVGDKKEETTQYLLFSDLIDQRRKDGTLIVRDADPANRPSFAIEYPRTDVDGSYFIIRTHTELMLE